MVPMTAEPIAPPIVRMLAFMPLATPVCCGGTAAMIRLARQANARPMPKPVKPTAIRMSSLVSWRNADMNMPTARDERTGHDDGLGPDAAGDRASR